MASYTTESSGRELWLAATYATQKASQYCVSGGNVVKSCATWPEIKAARYSQQGAKGQ